MNMLSSFARYIAAQHVQLTKQRQEITLLRDVVVTYCDRSKMRKNKDDRLQKVIDRAFDRD